MWKTSANQNAHEASTEYRYTLYSPQPGDADVDGCQVVSCSLLIEHDDELVEREALHLIIRECKAEVHRMRQTVFSQKQTTESNAQ